MAVYAGKTKLPSGDIFDMLEGGRYFGPARLAAPAIGLGGGLGLGSLFTALFAKKTEDDDKKKKPAGVGISTPAIPPPDEDPTEKFKDIKTLTERVISSEVDKLPGGKSIKLSKDIYTKYFDQLDDAFDNEDWGKENAHQDIEMDYHGGVGDLGDANVAQLFLSDMYQGSPKYSKTGESYREEYNEALVENAKKYLGEKFVGYRVARYDYLDDYNDGGESSAKITSFAISPKSALRFAYFANDYFMDLDTSNPRNDLILIEAPIDTDSLIMRGKASETEVVTETEFIPASYLRAYNIFTGEIIQKPMKGPLLNESPLKFGDDERDVDLPFVKAKYKEGGFVEEFVSGGFVDKHLMNNKKQIVSINYLTRRL